MNVSDGGHFDNLGLYEMIRRRCRYIVVVDAGADRRRSFEDLAGAIRRIRIDFGVAITISGMDLSIPADPQESGPAPRPVYVGVIDYKAADGDHTENGMLVYIKPTITGSEPADVQSYSRGHGDFPHESTADQWFSETQFESYRRLGQHTVTDLVGFYDIAKMGPQTRRTPPLDPGRFCDVMEEAARIRFRRVSHSSHAGGVVFQRQPEVAVKFLFVSSLDGTAFVLPKGRIEPGEHARTAALREVQEETGYASEQCAALGVFQFVSPSGVPPDVLPILARAEAELARPR